MSDLHSTYLGLPLRSPLVASAGPLTEQADTACLLEDAGAAALVMPSLFEEEVLQEDLGLNWTLEAGAENFPEALDYFPAVPELATVGDRYLARLTQIKARVDIPVIASLNGFSVGGWVRYANLMQEAGADAIELNLYRVAADPTRSAADIEAEDVTTITAVASSVDIPLAVKLSPYYSALANFAARVTGSGARGLVLFNRFYQPDIDLEALDVVPRIDLSQQWELRLPLRWIAILRPQLDPWVSLAATTGIRSGTDVVKALMVGADVAMMTSALLRDGPAHLATVDSELRAWLDRHEYTSVTQLRGSMSMARAEDPSAFERANYMRTLHSWAMHE